MSRELLVRAVVLVVVLLVPLALAVASQALASREQVPEVDPTPLRLGMTAVAR